MKVLFSIIFLLFFISYQPERNPQKTLNVLFIGNSMTYWNGMPEMLKEMLASEDQEINIEQSTSPGLSLANHLDYIEIEPGKNRLKEDNELTVTEKKLAEKKWDIVVLQEGTAAYLIPESKDKTNNAIQRIKKLIDNPDTDILLFSTWIKKGKYPKQYCNSYQNNVENGEVTIRQVCSIEILDLEHEIDVINTEQRLVSSSNTIHLTNHLNHIYELLKNHHEIDFYEDEIHPTKEGAYLNACLFYKYLTGKAANSISFDAQLPKTTTDILKNVADLDI